MIAKALLFTALCIQVIYGYPAAPFAAAPCAAGTFATAPFAAATIATAPFGFAYDAIPIGYGNGFYGDGPFGYGFGYDGFAGPIGYGFGYDGFAGPLGYGSYGIGYPAII